MANLEQGDPTNGAGHARGEDAAPSRRSLADREGVADRDRRLSEVDQTGSESDQTLADADQTSSDSDQTSSDADQLAAECDQAASDRDLTAGVDAEAHQRSREMRERTASQREQTAHTRLAAARERDVAAHIRDLAALARDQAARARDLAVARDDASSEQMDGTRRRITGAEIVVRAAEQRRRAARQRARAAEQRALAAEDRRLAAVDRDDAIRERQQALSDREALARQLATAAVDSLTGARTRTAGLGELDGELERCRRTGAHLAVVYVGVVGSHELDDEDGRLARDEGLKHIAGLIKGRLRPYDLVIRLGSDAFLCALSDATPAVARERFAQITATLAVHRGACGSISAGIAQLTGEDTAGTLIARAERDSSVVRLADGHSRPGRSDGTHPRVH
jgi:diguanylate cyclase (GGDEF)-like protein